jgi:hypothetical protein
MYLSMLTANSSTYSPTLCEEANYYYEAIQVNVVTTGCYNLSSKSIVDTFCYIYKDEFVPFNASINLISRSGISLNNTPFQLITYLEVNTSYVLVVTTSSPKVTGAFSIRVSGPNNVTFYRISEYLYCFGNN